MEQLVSVAQSPYLWSAFTAYIIGQIIKAVILMTRYRGLRLTFGEVFASGNMPSTHTSTVVALATTVGCLNGFDSALFGIALVLSIVVAYDACHVRRAVGDQGIVLAEIIDRHQTSEQILMKLTKEMEIRGEHNIKKGKTKLAKPYLSRGHLAREVVAGAVLGVIVGAIVAIITTQISL